MSRLFAAKRGLRPSYGGYTAAPGLRLAPAPRNIACHGRYDDPGGNFMEMAGASLMAYLWDFILNIDVHLFELVDKYGVWVYAILFLVVFCETGLVVTPFLPGDSLLFASGVTAGAGLMSYAGVMGILLGAGVLGDAANYFIGRHAGPAIFAKDTRFIKKEHLLKAHHFYETHGGKAIVLARFIPIVRTFAPFVAGIALMQPHTFFFFNIIGCILWVGSLVSAGFFLGNLPWARDNFSLIVYAIIIISVLPVAIEFIRHKLGKKTE